MAKSRLRRMHPRWLDATAPKRLKRGHMAQSLHEDTARSRTPCSYEVQLLDYHWGTLMAEHHIRRARLEAAMCTPMAERHSPRAKLHTAKKTPSPFGQPPPQRWHRLHCLPRARLSLDSRFLRTHCLRGAVAQGRGHRRGPRGLFFGVMPLLAAEGAKPLSSSALRRLPCSSGVLNSNPSNFHSVNSGNVIPFSTK